LLVNKRAEAIMNNENQKTILLVEDEAVIAVAFQKSLGEYGYKVITSPSAELAINDIEKTPGIDLVLMDIVLGSGISGLDAASIILKKRRVPIIFLTNYDDPELVGKAGEKMSYGYILKSSSISVLDSSIKMALKHFDADREIKEKDILLETQQKYLKLSREFEAILDHLPALVFYKDDKNRFIRVNKYVAQAYKKDKTELEGISLYDLYPEEEADKYYRDDLEVINSGAAKLDIEEQWGTAESLRWVNTSKIPFIDDNGVITGIIGISTDMTERKKAENELRKFSTAVDQSPANIVITGTDGTIEYVNPMFTTLTGYTFEEAIGQNPRILKSGDTPDLIYKKLWETILSGQVWRGVFHNKKKNGELYWEAAIISPIINDKGVITNFIAIKEDITKRKSDEDKIRQLLAEKELILKEVHHRIKNNMNTIISLLYLQAESLKDSAAITALYDAANRIQSMLILYEKLYQSKGFDKINVSDYLPSLIDEIISNFPDTGNIGVDKTIDNFELDIKKLQPLGIIINELLTNTMKYAFTGRNSGAISISVTLKDNTVCLVIADNGIGMPESVDFNNSNGFGMQLVSLLTEQLEGRIRIERGEGTGFVLEFDL
jgi:PAS domain S-box-containing protein